MMASEGPRRRPAIEVELWSRRPERPFEPLAEVEARLRWMGDHDPDQLETRLHRRLARVARAHGGDGVVHLRHEFQAGPGTSRTHIARGTAVRWLEGRSRAGTPQAQMAQTPQPSPRRRRPDVPAGVVAAGELEHAIARSRATRQAAPRRRGSGFTSFLMVLAILYVLNLVFGFSRGCSPEGP